VIVECPACHTRYRTDRAAVIAENTVFECSQEQCRHRFPYAFSLPPSAQLPEELDEPEDFTPLAVHLPPEAPFVAEQEDENEELSFPSHSLAQSSVEGAFSIRPLFILLSFIVLGYGTLGWYCRSHVAETEVALARLPWVGRLFIASQFSAQRITLTDFKSGFWLTKDGKRVFAVSGKVTNNAPVPAYRIQVEGELFDTNGKTVGQQKIFCGTETAAEVLPNLTVREIGILQNLEPPKQFNVPAGQAVNFLIVFTNPPPAVAELSCRVAAAQFGAS
jgi:hypothetical protein